VSDKVGPAVQAEVAGALTCRPEGPELNSHVREGVDQGPTEIMSAEGAVQVTLKSAGSSGLARSVCASHALTDVAIEYRPFGPEIQSPINPAATVYRPPLQPVGAGKNVPQTPPAC
jgi:hypothetical protein